MLKLKIHHNNCIKLNPKLPCCCLIFVHKFQCFGITIFNEILSLLLKGPKCLLVLTKLQTLCFLNTFPTCILVNKIICNKSNSIYFTFLSFEHIIVWFLYLNSII